MGNAQQQKKSIMEAMDNPQNDEKLRNAFDQYDLDKSGTLSLSEFEKFTADFFKILLMVSFINPKDVPYQDKAFAKALFDMTDTDKSGGVSFEEFKQTIRMDSALDLVNKVVQSIVGDVTSTI